MTARSGIVVIGRNEGPRLAHTLKAALAAGVPVVYVDSNSHDGSIAIATDLGILVVEMPLDEPLGAGRARNLGARELIVRHPTVQFIQFVDGDCLLDSEWMALAESALVRDPSLTAVCGWRLEARPRRNVYHRIANVEWQMGKVGDVSDFAGEVMIRAVEFAAVGGYNSQVVAGEDTELSSRLVARGGRIQRIDALTTVHDIDMTTTRQWWRRSERSGYGFALIARLHRDSDRLFEDKMKETVLWGAVGPAIGLVALRWTRLPMLLWFAKMIASGLRAAHSIHPTNASLPDRLAWGMACSLSTVPGAIGVARYFIGARRNGQPTLIEYK